MKLSSIFLFVLILFSSVSFTVHQTSGETYSGSLRNGSSTSHELIGSIYNFIGNIESNTEGNYRLIIVRDDFTETRDFGSNGINFEFIASDYVALQFIIINSDDLNTELNYSIINLSLTNDEQETTEEGLSNLSKIILTVIGLFLIFGIKSIVSTQDKEVKNGKPKYRKKFKSIARTKNEASGILQNMSNDNLVEIANKKEENTLGKALTVEESILNNKEFSSYLINLNINNKGLLKQFLNYFKINTDKEFLDLVSFSNDLSHIFLSNKPPTNLLEEITWLKDNVDHILLNSLSITFSDLIVHRPKYENLENLIDIKSKGLLVEHSEFYIQGNTIIDEAKQFIIEGYPEIISYVVIEGSLQVIKAEIIQKILNQQYDNHKSIKKENPKNRYNILKNFFYQDKKFYKKYNYNNLILNPLAKELQEKYSHLYSIKNIKQPYKVIREIFKNQP